MTLHPSGLPHRIERLVVTLGVASASLVSALVLVLIASAEPVSSAPRATAAPTRPTRVLALGDSVMEGAATAIPAALPGREVVVDTQVSRSTSATADAAATHGTDWDVVAIQVGTNDGASSGVYQPPYREMLDAFADVPRVVVLTIHEVRPYYAEVNAFLRSEAAARTNVVVADWNAASATDPNATAGDGLHLSGSGARLMADLIASEVAAAEAEAEPPPSTTAARTSTSTTTTTATTPPATTLPPPATAPTTAPTSTEPVVLIPAITAVRVPPSPAELAPPLRHGTRADGGDGPGTERQETPPAAWLTIVAVVGGLGAVSYRHRGTLPR